MTRRVPEPSRIVHKWTDDEVSRLAKMYGSGMTIGQCAEAFGLSKDTIQGRITSLRRVGDSRFPHRKSRQACQRRVEHGAEWKVEALRLLFVEYRTMDDVRKRMRCEPSTLRRYIVAWRKDGTISEADWQLRHARIYTGSSFRPRHKVPDAKPNGTVTIANEHPPVEEPRIIPAPSGSVLAEQVARLKATKGIIKCPDGYADSVRWMGAPPANEALVPSLSLRDPGAFHAQTMGWLRPTGGNPKKSRKRATRQSAKRPRKLGSAKADAALGAKT